MTPAKFFLRYTAIPFVAIVLVVGWAFLRESGEIDARQYAALVTAYPDLSPGLRDEVAQALQSGKLDKAAYAAIVRHSLDQGYVLDWPARDAGLDAERGKLLGLVNSDARPR
jgi:hypothetical protein